MNYVALFIAVVVIVVLVLAYMYYVGFFYVPTASVKSIDEMCIINLNVVGDYKYYNNVVKYFINYFVKNNLPCSTDCTTGSIYYDMVTPGCDYSKLRWSIFLVLSPEQYEEFAAKNLTGVTLMKIPKSRIAITTFPMRGVITYMLGPKRTYPVLHQLLAENNLTSKGCVELYDSQNIQPIRYIFYLDETPVFTEALNSLECLDASKL